MRQFAVWLLAAGFSMLVLASECHAVRVMTSPSTAPGDPALQFNNIALTPDGSTIVATGLFNIALTGDRVYSLAVPSNPAVDTATITQLSTQSFLVNQNYDVAFPPVISPNGLTILYTHDNGTAGASNTIYKMPIAGELNATSFTGLFGSPPNLVLPGTGNANPVYSPNGSTIYFLNSESGFGGSVPDFDVPAFPNPFANGPDWDQIYSVPAAGGTPTAVTLPGDGDIDVGLFAVTPNGTSIVYAPDNPVIERKDRDGIRPKLFTIATTGGTPTEIAMPAPPHEFSITNQLAMTPNGLSILFIGDYETLGKNELFSVPIGGGTPTRLSDNLPFAGDVYSFAVAPNGASVAYAAGQNTSSNTELFLTPITGGTGNSIRVSEPLSSNSGLLDVSTASDGGQILFSPDSTKIYYLGDMDTEDVNDLYVVDTTVKSGLVPMPFTFVGLIDGEFFNELNWQDALGNSPPAGSIDPNVPIRQSLIIDGDTVVATTTGEVSFQLGGSLEMTAGSMLSSVEGQLEFNPGSGLKLTDATISFREDIILSGTNVLTGGMIVSFADDIEFQDNHKSIINGTHFSAADNLIFDQSATSIVGATFEANDSISMRFEIDVTVTDTVLDLTDEGHLGGIEDRFNGPQGEGSTLTLKGASTLMANAIKDGVDLVLDGTSVATMTRDGGALFNLVDPNGTSTITFMSVGAEMILVNPSAFDSREYVINGLTGMSYLDDPSAWNVTNWDGLGALASLRLASVGLDGDYNGNGTIDAADYTAWRDALTAGATELLNDPTPGTVDESDFLYWRAHFGEMLGSGAGSGSPAAVPEPSALVVACIVSLTVCGLRSGANLRRKPGLELRLSMDRESGETSRYRLLTPSGAADGRC